MKKHCHLSQFFLLVVLFIVFAGTAKTSAETDDYTYTFDTVGYTDEVTITNCIGYGDSTTIPEEYSFRNSYGYYVTSPVKRLGYEIFSECKYLKKVTITISQPMTINETAFNNCSSLEEIVAAFGSYYQSESGILYNKNKETLIRCPEGKSGYVDISSSVTAIDNSAFYQCKKITGITIPSGVTTIGSSAFSGCENLTGIVIPASVTTIEGNAFKDCFNLKNIYFSCSREDIKKIGYHYGNTRIEFGEYDDMEASMIYELGLPENINFHYNFYPDDYQFYTLPDGTLEITGYTGTNTVVSIPAQQNGKPVSKIGSSAFENHTHLSSIELPSNIKVIGNSAFSGCTNLTCVSLSSEIEQIGSSAFDGCSLLQEIFYAGSASQWNKVNLDSSFKTKICYNCCPSDYTYTILKDGTAEIKGYSGSDTAITLPSWFDGRQITSIGTSAFSNQKQISDIGIPKSITTIKSNAFSNCSNIKNIYFSGNKKQWLSIKEEAGNNILAKANIHYDDNTNNTLDTYAVSFNAWGIKNVPSQTVEEFSLAADPGTLDRPGYQFLGWYQDDKKWDFEYEKVRSNVTLNAKWEEEEKVSVKKINGQQYYVDANGFAIIPLKKEFILDCSGLGAYSTYKGTTWNANSNIITPTSGTNRSFQFKGIETGTCTITASITTEYWWSLPGDNKLTLWDVNTTSIDYKYRITSYITSISMNKDKLTMTAGESCPLSYSTTPAGNYAKVLSGFCFSSSNEDVAVIRSDGIIIAKNPGTTTITAYTKDGFNGSTCKASCVLTVTQAKKTENDKPAKTPETAKKPEKEIPSKNSESGTSEESEEKDFLKAVDNFKNGNYQEALELWNTAAKKGHAFAMFYIGHCYETGKGVETDLAKAFEWYQKSAEADHPAGQFKVAYWYDIGNYVEKSASKAVEWYQKAIKHTKSIDIYRSTYYMTRPEEVSCTSVLTAMYNLAYKYQSGKGTKRDYKKAMDLYQQCAAAGDDVAMYRIGQFYEKGYGVKADQATAILWYQKAEEAGNTKAAAKLKKLKN